MVHKEQLIVTFFLALGPTLGSRQGSGLKAMKFGAQDLGLILVP